MESWKKVWRDGVEPLLTDEGLQALRDALIRDDPKLIQGATSQPPPLQCVQDWPCEAACALGYCGWVSEGLITVGDVENWFSDMCFKIDQRLGEPAGCRHFLTFFDETPRNKMRTELLAEINLAMVGRGRTGGLQTGGP